MALRAQQRALDKFFFFTIMVYAIIARPLYSESFWPRALLTGYLSLLLSLSWGPWLDDAVYSKFRNVAVFVLRLVSSSVIARGPVSNPTLSRCATGNEGEA